VASQAPHYLHDGAQREGSGRRTRWGTSCSSSALPCPDGRQVALVIERFPSRQVELLMDGAYASRAWRGRPDRVTVSTRMRGNAALHKLPPARQPARTVRCSRAPGLASHADRERRRCDVSTVTVTGRDDRERTVHVHEPDG
jgi:hypothetical protein